MAREFEELESFRRRPGRRDSPSDLPGLYMRGSPPPYERTPSRYTPEPEAPFDERFGPFDRPRERGMNLLREEMRRPPPPVVPKGMRAIQPGYQERFLDETKVISELGVPPSLNQSNMRKTPIRGLDQLESQPQPQAPDPYSVIQQMLERRMMPPVPQYIPGRARGGKIKEGEPTLVGEEGPEKVRFAQAKGGATDDSGYPPLPEGATLVAPKTEYPPLPAGATLVDERPRMHAGGGVLPNEPGPRNLPAPGAGRSREYDPIAGMEGVQPMTAEGQLENVRMGPESAVSPAPTSEGMEGEGMLGGALIPALGRGIAREAENTAQAVGRIRRGEELNPLEPLEQAFPLSPRAIGSRMGRVIAGMRNPDAAAQIETGVMSIPSAATMGPAGQAFGRGIAAAPIGGTELRRSAEKTSAEMAAAGEAAAARPLQTAEEALAARQERLKEPHGWMRGGESPSTTPVPTQAEAGTVLRDAIRDNIEAVNVTRGMAARSPEAAEVPNKVRRMLGKSDEDLVNNIITMAGTGTKSGADTATLAAVRGYIPAHAMPEIQSAVVTRLGHSPATNTFDPATWVRNYSGISDGNKTILFGEKGSGLRYHLDSLEAVARRAASWQQFDRKAATLGGRAGAGAIAAAIAAPAAGVSYFSEGAWAGPITLLGTVIPAGILARSMARPAVAAPLAQYSRAYERFVRSGGAPAGIAALKMATDNLSNSLGYEFDMTDFVSEKSSQLQKGASDLEQRALDRLSKYLQSGT